MPYKVEPSKYFKDQVLVTIFNPDKSIKHQCAMSLDSWRHLSDLDNIGARAFWGHQGITDEDFDNDKKLRGDAIMPLEG